MERELNVASNCVYNPGVRRRVCGWYNSVRTVAVLIGFLTYFMVWIEDVYSVQLKIAAIGTVVTLLIAVGDAGRRRASVKAAVYGEELRNRLELRYGNLSQLEHVGYTPTKEPRSYSGDESWDVGFLACNGSLEYYGDQERWRLLPADILQVKVCGYFRPRLLLLFLPRGGTPRWICLESRTGGSRTERYANLQLLRIRIAMMNAPAALPAGPGSLARPH